MNPKCLTFSGFGDPTPNQTPLFKKLGSTKEDLEVRMD